MSNHNMPENPQHVEMFHFLNSSGICSNMKTVPDSKVHGTNMGSIWGRQDLGGPHVGPMNFAIWGIYT